MQILAIPPGIAAVCALPRPKIHRFYLSHQASNTALAQFLPSAQTPDAATTATAAATHAAAPRS
ncbi:hypothetical protein FUT63_04895 [Extensimonas vulgaris]|nr:hypothetical protein FUT63_04895 [Extensimonas vulgaris]